MSMWEPFTEPGRQSIVRAQEVAQQHGDAFIGHNHIFAALIDDTDVAGALHALGVDSERARKAAEQTLGQASSPSAAQEMVFTPEAKRMIELAFDNARKLDNNFIGPEHLALGYIALGPRHTQVITALEIDAEKFRGLLIASLDKKPKHRSGTPASARSELSLEGCFTWIGRRKIAELRPQALWDALSGAAAEKNLGAALAYAFLIARLNGWSADDTAHHIMEAAKERFES